jgi:aminoglycoside phosphotransferase (APT) family kinase protein
MAGANDFLHSKYSLIPLLYFSSLQPGDSVLLATDNPQRLKIGFSPFDIHVTVLLLDNDRTALPMDAGGNRRFIRDFHELAPESQFNLILTDFSRHDYTHYLPKLVPHTNSASTLIVLDWQDALQIVLRQLPYALGLSKRKPARAHKMEKILTGFRLQVKLFPEPSLNKPRYYVLPGFGSKIPSESQSELKQRLVKGGLFYFFARHRILVFAGPDAGPSLLSQVLDNLPGSGMTGPVSYSSLDMLYLSSTNVFILRVRTNETIWFIRFPFSSHSINRIATNHQVTAWVHSSQVVPVPAPAASPENFPVPVFIERGMSGRAIGTELATMPREQLDTVLSETITQLVKLHRHFGKIETVDEKQLKRYIASRVESIRKHTAQYEKDDELLTQLENFLNSVLSGKRVMRTLVHGDFKIGNCLYDDSYRVSAVLDWDMVTENDLGLFDLANFYSVFLRARNRISYPQLLTEYELVATDFLPVYQSYFELTGSDYIEPYTAILLNWIDRVAKQLTHNPETTEGWVRTFFLNVLPRLPEQFN